MVAPTHNSGGLVADYYFAALAMMVMRVPGENDKAWHRRRKQACVQHRKNEKQRYRRSQRTATQYRPIGLDIIDTWSI
jgi:hypothetical protein